MATLSCQWIQRESARFPVASATASKSNRLPDIDRTSLGPVADRVGSSSAVRANTCPPGGGRGTARLRGGTLREPGTRMGNLNASWQVVRKEAHLEDVRIHDLRHSFASRALALGESLPMIGKLLGHRQVQTTARYAHLARHSVKAAALRIEDSLAVDMDVPANASAPT